MWGGRRSPEEFLDRLGPVTRARRSSTDDACSCLEPDLMDGAGGLADLATIRWIEAVAGPREIPSEPGALTEAAELLHRVRNELHYITGRNTDILQMQYHVPVAEAFAPHASVPAPEVQLMRRLYESCRTIAFALDSLLSAGDDGGQAGTFVSLFPLGANAQPIPKWSTKARESFVGLLSTGPEGRAGFRALERSGALAVELAARIGPERRLRLLYLLTVADARATGPAAWSTWKSTLISRLFTRVTHVLRRGELAGADTSEVVADKIDGVKAALSDYPPAVLERHLADMPKAWFLSQSLRGLVDQSIQM